MARTKNKRRKVRQREMEAARRMAVEQEAEEEQEEEEEKEDEEAEEQHLLTDYEKQRERRIKENAEKLAALKLPSLSSSFRHAQHGAKQRSPVAAPRRSSRLKKSNDKDVEEDDDYRPSDDGINSETEDSDEEEARPRAKRLQQCSSDFDANGDDEEDRALQQALALSLGTSVDLIVGTPRLNAKRFDGGNEMKPRRQKKGGKEQLQFTDDEITSFFSIIDEKGKGKFSVTELEHAARAYDFTWNEQEIFDMIDIFDKNKDGQLDLSEFRGVFVLGNMMKTP